MLQEKKIENIVPSIAQRIRKVNHFIRLIVIIHLLPMVMYRKKSHGVINDSFALRGGRSIMSKSGGLKPRAVAGKPSVTKLTQSNCTGINDSGKPRAAVKKIQTT
jgi:hypothetical protein